MITVFNLELIFMLFTDFRSHPAECQVNFNIVQLGAANGCQEVGTTLTLVFKVINLELFDMEMWFQKTIQERTGTDCLWNQQLVC